MSRCLSHANSFSLSRRVDKKNFAHAAKSSNLQFFVFIIIFLLLFSSFISCLTTTLATENVDNKLMPSTGRRPATSTNSGNIDTDIILVCTLSGKLKAISKSSGKELWELNDVGAILSSSSDSRRRHAGQEHSQNAVAGGGESSKDLIEASKKDKNNSYSSHNRSPTYIIEPIGPGYLYIKAPGKQIEKFPLTIKELVSSSPLKTPDGTLYIGKKHSKFISVDLRNGEIKETFTSASSAAFHQQSNLSTSTTPDGQYRGGSADHSQILLIGRTEYSLSIYHTKEKEKGGKDKNVNNLFYAQISTGIHEKFEYPKELLEMDSFVEYVTSFNGLLICRYKSGKENEDEPSKIKWTIDLNEPATSLFHIHNILGENYLIPIENAIASHDHFISSTDIFLRQDPELPIEASAADSTQIMVRSDLVTLDVIEPITETEDLTFYLLPHAKYPVLERFDISGDEGVDYDSDGEREYDFHNLDDVLMSGENESELEGEMGANSLLLSGSTGGGGGLSSDDNFSFNNCDDDLVNCLKGVKLIYSYSPILEHNLLLDKPFQQQFLEQQQQDFDSLIRKAERADLFATLFTLTLIIISIYLYRSWKRRVNLVNQPRRDSVPRLSSALTVSEQILGYGSHGTVVYKGKFDGRDVAVKRLLVDFFDIAEHEVTLLQHSDSHPHVIRYYYREKVDKFIFVVLELCRMSLLDLLNENGNSSAFSSKNGRMSLGVVNSDKSVSSILSADSTSSQTQEKEKEKEEENLNSIKQQIRSQISPQEMIHQITLGLHHLHSLNIIHRDIKPGNILISSNHHRLLISDFGLCKRLVENETSFNPTVNSGTIGWRAPELILADELDKSLSEQGANNLNSSLFPTVKVSKSVDIFAAGCLFYYILSGGKHPFGDDLLRENNIAKGYYDLSAIKSNPEANDLIQRMILKDPLMRPSTAVILAHPYFWDSNKRLSFLQDLSDRLELEDPSNSNVLNYLESQKKYIIGHNWHKLIDQQILEDLEKYRKYSGYHVRGLLRALRNKKHHYQDLSDELKEIIGELPTGFLKYFTDRFPNLLISCYYAVKDSPLASDSQFQHYFAIPVTATQSTVTKTTTNNP